MKKTAIIYASVHHKNTEHLLKEAVKNLSVDLLTVKEAESADFSAYRAVGFASGIYAGKLHASIYKYMKNHKETLPQKCFILCTSGLGKGSYAKKLPRYFESKGFEVLGAFECKGFDTFAFFKLFGGIAKNHPDEKDIQNAAAFLKSITKAE